MLCFASFWIFVSFPFSFVLLILSIQHEFAKAEFHAEGCGDSFFVCQPEGAISNTIGVPGSDWKELYPEILSTINDISANMGQRTNGTDGPAKRDSVFCCVKTTQCLLLETHKIPMCWDRFTTNIFFPDGAHGTVVNGTLSTAAGDTADLVYGNYFRRDGTVGNIYDDDGQTKLPDTRSMELPTPWTSSGIGTAIPATELGFTASVPGTNIAPATTQPPLIWSSLTITMIATMSGCGHCAGSNTTIPGITIPGSSRPGSTGPSNTNIHTTSVPVPPYAGVAPHLNALKTSSTIIFAFVMQMCFF